jgi:hypothetical protein
MGYQYYAKQNHQLVQALQMIPITWPFTVWCVDMIGEFKKSPQGFDHLLVAIDKFTKWIKVRPIINPNSKRVAEFI